MAKINFSKIATRVLSQQEDEKRITEYKEFYKKYLSSIKEKTFVLEELNKLCIDFFSYKFQSIFTYDKLKNSIENNADNFLSKYFPNEISEIFNKKPERKITTSKINDDKPILAQLILGLLKVPTQLTDEYKDEWNYKTKYLLFIYNCFSNTGLNPLIDKREAKIYKRYNIFIEHDFKSRVKQKDFRIFLNLENLQNEFLKPYEQKHSILINGKLIPHKNIHQIKITSTLLLDDEIELFAIKNNFLWSKNNKDELAFINNCVNETDTILKNPFLKKGVWFRSNNEYFIHPDRITELEKLKKKKEYVIKLIQLCKELNNISIGANVYSPTLLVRAIIDYVPPIFGYKNFSEVANNYKDGGRSFKKSMLTLDNSARNIADNNIHSQSREKEVLPTSLQSDFTPELDWLLGEIIRILK